MKQKKLFFRLLALLLVMAISYVQLAQFGHSFHHRSASVTVPGPKQVQIQTMETSCLLCDYLLHTQSKHNCITVTSITVEPHQMVSELVYFYRIAEPTFFRNNYNNKGPPLA